MTFLSLQCCTKLLTDKVQGEVHTVDTHTHKASLTQNLYLYRKKDVIFSSDAKKSLTTWTKSLSSSQSFGHRRCVSQNIPCMMHTYQINKNSTDDPQLKPVHTVFWGWCKCIISVLKSVWSVCVFSAESSQLNSILHWIRFKAKISILKLNTYNPKVSAWINKNEKYYKTKSNTVQTCQNER